MKEKPEKKPISLDEFRKKKEDEEKAKQRQKIIDEILERAKLMDW